MLKSDLKSKMADELGFDLYDDLDEACISSIKQVPEPTIVEDDEKTELARSLMKLKVELEMTKASNKQLQINMSSLTLTAKSEIARQV